MDEIKREYNALITRFKNAEKFFDSPYISQEEKESRVDSFREILYNLDRLSREINSSGKEMTEDEYFNGFRV